MGAIFFCRVANFNALGIIEDSCLVHAAYRIEMRMGRRPIRESVSYAPPRVHFYIGDFGYNALKTSYSVHRIDITTVGCRNGPIECRVHL